VRPGDRERWIARAGGVEDGTTDADATHYTVTAPPEALALILWLESDRMGFLADTLTAEVLDRERHLVVDELRDVHCKRVDPDVLGRLEILPDWHPYHRRLCNGEVLGVKLADVRAFLTTWYGPSNATIAIAGRFDPASAHALIDRYFATLPGSDVPERPALTAEWPSKSVRLEVGSLDPQETVTFVWRGSPLHTRADAALDVAGSLLSDPAGPLRRDLDRLHLAAFVNAREQSFLRDSIFTLTVGLRDGAAPDDVIAAVDRAVTDLGAGVAPDAFERARAGWSDWTMSLLETSRGRVGRMLEDPDIQEPLEFDSHAGLTATDVQEAVRARLVPDLRATVVVHHGHYPLLGVVLSRKTVTP
jgi:predicted Zn-dependent peptidase